MTHIRKNKQFRMTLPLVELDFDGADNGSNRRYGKLKQRKNQLKVCNWWLISC